MTPELPRPNETLRALVLHEQQLIVDLIRLTLDHGLFEVRSAGSMLEAHPLLTEWRPHISIVDMDHHDSGTFLERIGKSDSLSHSLTLVLGLTRRGDLRMKLRAFDMGVDDILTMPFSPEELLARVLVITRRATRDERQLIPTIRLGEMEIDILNREIKAGTSVIRLSGIEQSLLYVLASRSGRIVSREEILDSVWGVDFVAESNVVDRHVRSLRVKLQDDYRHPRFIATVPGQGYRFVPTFSSGSWAVETTMVDPLAN